jgi:hypothetical protein
VTSQSGTTDPISGENGHRTAVYFNIFKRIGSSAPSRYDHVETLLSLPSLGPVRNRIHILCGLELSKNQV